MVVRHLVERDADGDYFAGPYLAVLSRGVRRSVRAAAAPVLANLAEELGMTAFLVVPDRDEAVTVDSVEPTSLDAHVAYRPGTRHPIDRGAPGIALLAGRPVVSGERPEVSRARALGWAVVMDLGGLSVHQLRRTDDPRPVRFADRLMAGAAEVRRRLGL